jgi:hypothetical protein
MSAAAIFQLSWPSDRIGNKTYATVVPSTLATVLVTTHKGYQSTSFFLGSKKKEKKKKRIGLPDPMRNALKRWPVARTTRRRSAPRRSSGTAAGSRYSMTAPWAGAPGDTSPAAVAASPVTMLTSAPLSVAPHGVLSSDLHSPSRVI